MAPAKFYFLEIQGVGDSNGKHRYCYPAVPTAQLADAQYSPGLAEPPEGASGKWDPLMSNVSGGRWRIFLIPDEGPCDFRVSQPEPSGELANFTSAGNTVLNEVGRLNQRTVNGYAFIGRETVLIAANPSTDTYTMTRAQFDSPDVDHGLGADIFDGPGELTLGTLAAALRNEAGIQSGPKASPPAMIGRKVLLFECSPLDATVDAVKIRIGYLQSESAYGPAGNLVFEAFERFSKPMVNRSPVEERMGATTLSDSATALQLYLHANPNAAAGESVHAPPLFTFGGDGGYWWIPAIGKVIKGSYDDRVAIAWDFRSNTQVWPEWQGRMSPDLLNDIDPGGMAAYQIAWGGAIDYPTFGYISDPDGSPAFVGSRNPIDPLLNILLSKDGTNYIGAPARGWDLGTALFPHAAFGIDIVDVDLQSFTDARDQLDGIVPASFWIGGPNPKTLEDVVAELLLPFGYALGFNGTVWRLMKIGDVFPGVTTTTITPLGIGGDIAEYTQAARGRALSKVILRGDLSPEGKPSSATATIEEITGQTYYPEEIGAVEDLAVAYPMAILRDRVQLVGALVAARMRRFGRSSTSIRGLIIGADAFGLKIGDAIEIHSSAFRNPRTGERSSSGDTLKGFVTSARAHLMSRQTEVEILLADSGKVALHAPSASWVSGVGTALVVAANAYSDPDLGLTDAEHFKAGDTVSLIDERGIIQDASGVLAADGSGTSLTLAEAFSPIPSTGDDIVFSDHPTAFNSGNAAQLNHAFAGSLSTGYAWLDDDAGEVAAYEYGD